MCGSPRQPWDTREINHRLLSHPKDSTVHHVLRLEPARASVTAIEATFNTEMQDHNGLVRGGCLHHPQRERSFLIPGLPLGRLEVQLSNAPSFRHPRWGRNSRAKGEAGTGLSVHSLLADLEAKTLKASELHGMVISCLPGALRCGNAGSGPAKGAHPGLP